MRRNKNDVTVAVVKERERESRRVRKNCSLFDVRKEELKEYIDKWTGYRKKQKKANFTDDYNGNFKKIKCESKIAEENFFQDVDVKAIELETFTENGPSFLCALSNKRTRSKCYNEGIKRKHKNKLACEQGITLLSLIITVVIMIILAAVTINVTLGDGGLIDQAQHAAEVTVNSTQAEQEQLASIEQELANILAEPSAPEIGDIKPGEGEPVEIFENTTEVKDDLDNTVWIPGGFGIAEDSGTKVEEGIVIEDSSGNQFVWIPTGTYNVSTTINSSGQLTNNLSRRTFTTTRDTEVNEDSVIEGHFYGEGDSHSVAREQIGAFKASAESIANGGKGGFYIGRYEQGEGNVCKAGVVPYTNITRGLAKTQAEAMYNSNNVESELISSYAWDTALNFICQTNSAGYTLAMTSNSNYGNIGTNIRQNTGVYATDKYSNIHDFLGNCREWSTEYSSFNSGSDDNPCVCRGAFYSNRYGVASSRAEDVTSASYGVTSFRLQLYVK